MSDYLLGKLADNELSLGFSGKILCFFGIEMKSYVGGLIRLFERKAA